MNKEFVNYELALALKELGFDEPCFGRYWIKDFQLRSPKNYNADNEKIDSVSAPLYQQAFRWFREKYDLFGHIEVESNNSFYWHIRNPEQFISSQKSDTYEEAEQACINKLIEIVKDGTKINTRED